MSEFLEQLNYEIEQQKTINADPDLYIKHKGIKSRDVNANNLPIQAMMGTCHFIKNNTILKIYSWYDPYRSVYVQVNVKKAAWMSKVYIINRGDSLPMDIGDFQPIYNQDDLRQFILYLLQIGFRCYI